MAAANATIVLKITESMRLGALTRSLPVLSYVQQLIDSDAAGIRALKVTPPLTSTSRCDVSREEIRSSNDDWSFRMPTDKKKKILELLNEGLSPRMVAQRCGVSDPTIYRIRMQAQGKAAHSRQSRQSHRRLTDSVIDELCAAYANGETLTALAAQFRRTPSVLLGELRLRGVGIRKTGPRPRKAAPAQCLVATPPRCYQHVTVEQVREAIAAVEGGETWKSVAKKMGLSRESLRRNARRLGGQT